MNKILIGLLVFASASCHMGRFFNFALAPERRMPFGGPHDLVGFMNRIAQFQNRIERRMHKFSVPIVSEVVVVEDKEEAVPAPVAAPASKYDHCLDELNVILDNFVKMAALCLDKKWQDTIPIFQKTVNLIVEDVKCFKDAAQHSQLPAKLTIDPQCIIDHLKRGGDILAHIFEDLKRFDWNAIQHHIQELVEVIADIKNC